LFVSGVIPVLCMHLGWPWTTFLLCLFGILYLFGSPSSRIKSASADHLNESRTQNTPHTLPVLFFLVYSVCLAFIFYRSLPFLKDILYFNLPLLIIILVLFTVLSIYHILTTIYPFSISAHLQSSLKMLRAPPISPQLQQ